MPALAPLHGIGFAGEVAGADPAALAPLLPALLDPGAARRTLHWGRNYLWLADWPRLGAVVVKQFRHEAWRARLRKRLGGSKARKSFVAARALAAAGVPTPEPLLWLDADDPGGPSYYVCRWQEGLEARYPLRALAAGTLAADYPDLPAATLLGALAELARRLHAAGFWHRDLSAGNLLLHRASEDASERSPLVASIVDLNRCRPLSRLRLSHRLRDLARLSVVRRDDQEALLAAYFGSVPPAHARWLYRLYHASFHGRHRLKNRLRARRGNPLLALGRRRAYPHLPAPPADASPRDRAVWDRLSDQPHQHASAASKLLVRLADAPAHLRATGVALAAAPRVARRYRALLAALPPAEGGGDLSAPQPFAGAGVALRPHPADPDALLAAVDALGVGEVLLRLHPWEEEHAVEEALARELAARGYRLIFALPQRRELVRDCGRWRAAVARLGAAFAPYGSAFQVGQAINRSKWGVWSLAELAVLAQVAAEELARFPGTELVGPGVIDFEPHATAAAVNWPGLGVRFAALTSLLYVDRRGAPEARQLGCDALRKALLLRAVAETSRWCAGRSWVTEVNWPLREGPHAPAGRDVAVDEPAAADYLVRYYLPLLASGAAERVYWWQLLARGYGLLVEEEGALRRRPAFHALATLQRELAGSTCVGTLPAPQRAFLYRFVTAGGDQRVAGWSAGGACEALLPWRPARVVGRDGDDQTPPPGEHVALTGSVRYFHCRE